jgi:diacylglycerol kinase (ATP)
MGNALIILNPVAGNTERESIEKALDQRFASNGKPYKLHQTNGQERVEDVVRSALDDGFDLIVAAGGDGTVSAVAGGLINSHMPLGIIPVGTGNILARDLGIPLDINKATELLVREHDQRSIDAFQVGERFFVVNVSIGLSSQIMRDTGSDHKRHLGRLAYIRTALEKFIKLRSQRFDIIIDGKHHGARASEVAILNSSATMLGHTRWLSDVRLDDGCMDVYAFRADTIPDLLRVAWNLLLRRPASYPHIQHWVARRYVTIRSQRRLAVQADGDIIGKTPVDVRIVPRALQVIVPKPQASRN